MITLSVVQNSITATVVRNTIQVTVTGNRNVVLSLASDPAGGYDGQMIINTTSGHLKVYYGGVWHIVCSVASVPVETFNILTESGNNLITENGDQLTVQ